MPISTQRVQYTFVREMANFPATPDENTLYFVQDVQRIYVGSLLIADATDVDLSEYKVKNVNITGSGNYLKSVAFDEDTGILSILLDTLPVPSKGSDEDTGETTLYPGDSFPVGVGTSVDGYEISDKFATYTLPDQIDSVTLENGSNPGSVKLTVSTTESGVAPTVTEVQVVTPNDFMKADGGVATDASVSLHGAPVNDLDAATKKYVDDAISSISGGMNYLGKSSTPITDGGAEYPTIDGQVITELENGDIVIYSGDEFIWNGHTNCWDRTNDETAYALKDTKIIAGEGLAGGGDLSTDRTLSHGSTGSGSAQTYSGDVTDLEVVSSVTVDKFGHVSDAQISSLNGTVQSMIDDSVQEAIPRWEVVEPTP